MLYRVLKTMIERGLTDGLTEKIDVFLAVGRLTEGEYTELISLIDAEGDEA